MVCSRVDRQGVVSSRGHERAADESEALAQGCEVRARPEKLYACGRKDGESVAKTGLPGEWAGAAAPLFLSRQAWRREDGEGIKPKGEQTAEGRESA